jgi:hypothetical protein
LISSSEKSKTIFPFSSITADSFFSFPTIAKPVDVNKDAARIYVP